MGKPIIHTEEYYVLKRGNRYFVEGVWSRVSPLDASRFYLLTHAMRESSRWDRWDIYKDIKIVKCTLEVRET